MSTNNSVHDEIEEAPYPLPSLDIELAVVPVVKNADPFLVAFNKPFDLDNPKYMQILLVVSLRVGC